MRYLKLRETFQKLSPFKFYRKNPSWARKSSIGQGKLPLGAWKTNRDVDGNLLRCYFPQPLLAL